MSSFFQDLRFGLRQLAAKPGFAVAAILTLALGIGANTAVFSLLSGYLLKPLPYPHGGLAKISVEMPKLMPGDMPVSMPMYQVIREHSNAFTAVAMYWGDQYNLQVGGRAQEVLAYAVSASLFRVLGVQPLLGRTFTDANMHQGHNHVAVISYGLWRGSFGADPGVIGKTVRFNGEPYDIIGVMPKGFAFPDREAALWAPVTIAPDDFAPQHFFSLDGSLIGWLKPSVNVNGARERVRQAIGTWLTAHIPYKTADGDLINKALLQKYGFAMQVQPYRQDLLGDRPATLWLLQGAVLLILLITCVNVANLLLSRVLGRSHEMAMRSALGASRVTLGRQLLGEALCLTVPAGLGGVALAWLALHFLAGSALGAGNSIFNMTLDWRVGLFALAAVLFTALLVSVLPIRQLAKTDLQL
ncbi:MAG TPA: ABC transporter permease, partial [Gammaproteobacteria bacterium]|nr:ABC transporter permease [Gammaproteobacteria bacterium]